MRVLRSPLDRLLRFMRVCNERIDVLLWIVRGSNAFMLKHYDDISIHRFLLTILLSIERFGFGVVLIDFDDRDSIAVRVNSASSIGNGRLQLGVCERINQRF